MILLNTLMLATTVAAVTAFTIMPELTVSSSAFKNNGYIPAKYSCEGEEVSLL